MAIQSPVKSKQFFLKYIKIRDHFNVCSLKGDKNVYQDDK